MLQSLPPPIRLTELPPPRQKTKGNFSFLAHSPPICYRHTAQWGRRRRDATKSRALSLSLSLSRDLFSLFKKGKKYERLQNNAGNVARKNAQPITFMASLFSSTPTLFRLSKKKNIFPIVARKFSTFFFRGKMKFPLPFPLLSIFFLSGEKKVLGDLFAVCVSAPDPYFSTNVTLFRGPLGRRLGLAWGGEGGGKGGPGYPPALFSLLPLEATEEMEKRGPRKDFFQVG